MIYLDNAATSFPKPPSVAREVARAIDEYGGNAGRGAHSLSLAAAGKIYECRCALAELFGVDDERRVFFTQNATHGINTVIKGLLREGDHVLISDMEHNAVLRPIAKLAAEGRISYDVFSTYPTEPYRSAARICASASSLMRENTKMLFCNHASNICSATLPLAELAALCKRRGVLLCVDASQSAGHVDISVDSLGIAALCVPGHKGLYGPQGSGAVMLGREVRLDTLTEGGNGVDSLSHVMTDSSPERYEVGTLSTPAIAGLCEGVRFVRERGIAAIAAEEARLGKLLYDRLSCIGKVEIYAPYHSGGILLFGVKGRDSEELASSLDACGVCVRAGLHCAPLAHQTLGTQSRGGVRVSLGAFNTRDDVDGFCRALKTALT